MEGTMQAEISYDEWLETTPESFKRDALWKFETFRKALFVADLAWLDCEKLITHPLGRGIAWQLIESAGSVSANIEEGYGRGFGKDYARFLRVALGSARETRGWYWKARRGLDAQIVVQRIKLLDEIIAGLVTTSDQQRRLSP
jgi:four helix bundle protein